MFNVARAWLGADMEDAAVAASFIRGPEIDSSSSSSYPQAQSTSSSASVITNYPLISPLLAFTIAQLIKFFTAWYKEGRWDFKRLVGSGGMPSSHSATVSALAVSVGFQEGFGGSPFSIALVLACIVQSLFSSSESSDRSGHHPLFDLIWVMYDAFGVRLQAGRQAEVLNQIVCELPAEHPLAESRPLRELLGHTPPQVVAGCLLGIVTACIGHLMSMIGS